MEGVYFLLLVLSPNVKSLVLGAVFQPDTGSLFVTAPRWNA